MSQILKKSASMVNTNDVPYVDIEAPLAVSMNESTVYETGITPKNKFLYILGSFGFFAIIFLTGIALYFYLNYFKVKMEDKSVIATENKIIQEEQIQLDKSSIYFEILNGSGVAGEARKVGNSIEEVGYKVVSTGNTTRTKGNKLYLDLKVQEHSKQIIADLAKFDISTVSGVLNNSSVSARLIIGK